MESVNTELILWVISIWSFPALVLINTLYMADIENMVKRHTEEYPLLTIVVTAITLIFGYIVMIVMCGDFRKAYHRGIGITW